VLLAKISTLVGTNCEDNDILFIKVVDEIREKYDRLLTIRPASALNFDSALYAWVENLPHDLYRKACKTRYFSPHKFTFHRVLKECEEYVGLLESQSRYAGRRSKGRDNSQKTSSKTKMVNAVGATEAAQELSLSEDQDLIMIQPSESETQDNQGHVIAAAAVEKPQQGNRYGRYGRQFVTYHSCNLCLVNDHKTIDCKVEFTNDKLRAVVKERRICLACGGVGHWAKRCPIVLLIGESTILCKEDSCGKEPHCSKFCCLMSSRIGG
jgi:hypothetical protein